MTKVFSLNLLLS